MKWLLICLVGFAALILAFAISRIIQKSKPYNIKIFNKTIDGSAACFVKKLILKNEHVPCNELPSYGYCNFLMCDSKESPPKGEYYSFMRATGTLYKATYLDRKLQPGESRYEEIHVSPLQSKRLKFIFRMY